MCTKEAYFEEIGFPAHVENTISVEMGNISCSIAGDSMVFRSNNGILPS
jgi:hypothetical protein